MSKDTFKEFVKKNPYLINYIKSNEMTWQKFYEMYDLYGEDNDIWKDYLKEDDEDKIKKTVGNLGFNEFVNWLKSVNLDGLQEGIGNIQRVIGIFQDFAKKDSNDNKESEYKPRPIYKHFED